MITWRVMSPHGILHVVRGEKALRQLCRENGLSYDRLAKHVGHKELGANEKTRPEHVKGWRLLSQSLWLQKEKSLVCVVGGSAADFIKHANSHIGHPICGAFHEEDVERLAHLLTSGWVWSNSEKVKHMHGWTLLHTAPANAERLVISLPAGSAFGPDKDAAMDGDFATGLAADGRRGAPQTRSQRPHARV